MTVASAVRGALATGATLVLYLAQPQPARAQTAGAQDGAPVLEEITVSARKVTEKLQDVPISITALTANDIEAHGAQNLSGIARLTPNLTVDSTAAVSGSSVASTIFIRGIGQTDFTLNSDPGVGVYIDGVYLARSVGSLLDLVDIQSVEVLRGPQGTLFGKNTVGGALNVTSRPPQAQGGGEIEFEAGNFARHNVKARVDAPISDTLLTSLSFAALNEDGYQRRILQPDSPELGNVDRVVARGRALWTPTSEFTVDYIMDYSRGREQSVPQSVLTIVPTTGAPFLPAAAGLIPGTSSTLRPQFAGQFSSADLFNGTFISKDPDSTYYGGPSRSDFNIWGNSLTLAYDLGGVQLKSITAFRRLTSNFARDSLSSPFLVADTYDNYLDKQWSQEFQLSGRLPDNWGNYVAGVYYLGETGFDSNLVATSIGNLLSGGAVDDRNLSAFAQTNVNLSEKLGATAGVRYTNERKEFSPGYEGAPQTFQSSANGLGLGLPPVVPLVVPGNYSTTTGHVDFTVSLQYHLTDGLMSYVSYSTGFKSGGFSQRIGPSAQSPLAAPPSFRPETVGVAELGLKWLGLGNRLRLNGDVFHTNYKDMQITPIFEGIGPVTRNAGNAEIIGGELDFAFAPERHWDFSGGLGFLTTRYKSLTPETLADLNLDGTPVLTLHSRLAKSPHTSANLTAAHHWDLPQNNQLTLSVDGSYTSKLFNDVLNSTELERPNLFLLGGSLTFNTADKKWLVSARGTNLTDKRYIIAGNAERYAANIGYTQATYARGREYWLEIKRSF
ncbi:MAG: TonB-dependent receptor [Proteobacteria bacterium]|nr:TonB-dependent receptor [Pseudomonadota bacterium]